MFIKLACKSLLNRKGSIILTLIAISVSVFVLLGVEHIRHQAKESFTKTVSGIDLIVGARTSNLNLLLYSVFRIGQPSKHMSWESYQDLKQSKDVNWAVPLTLGDSHKGYSVIGTTPEYFTHFKYGSKQTLVFTEGRAFYGIHDVVIGSEVAAKLNYSLDSKVIVSHGVGSVSFSHHEEHPLRVVGILAPTGTPVDQALYVSLEGLEAMHSDGSHSDGSHSNSASSHEGHAAHKDDHSDHDHAHDHQTTYTPKYVTAVLVGLKSKMLTFRVQHNINNYEQEALVAILPGVALSELWQMMGVVEKVLKGISILVLIASLLGLSALLYASIRERKHEIVLLRSIGASPWFIFFSIQLEAMIVTLSGILLGAVSLYLVFASSKAYFSSNFGLYLEANILSSTSSLNVAVILVLAFIAIIFPAFTAFIRAKHSHV